MMWAGVASIAALGLFWACLPRSDGPYKRQTDDDAGPPDPVDLDAGAGDDDVHDLPDAAPHAVLSISPNHGPFTGGQTVLIRGNGFGSNARVWFGDTRVPADDVVPVDASRIQVTVPEGQPGAVDVVTQNGSDSSTRSELSQGYIYDAFYVDPASGPTSGGTEVTLYGSQTDWDEDTEVLIDLKPCEDLERISKTELRCTTPQGTTGAKTVRVTTSDEVEVDVLDAFIYGDAETNFRGGLSGQPLDDELSVTVLDNITGRPIGGATVIRGAKDPEVEFANTSGTVSFKGDFDEAQTITVAAKCFSPVTFVAVPVDTVVAYLDPVLDLRCADFSDIPALPGGPGGSGSTVNGELLWPNRSEFERGGWTNVPPPKGKDERYVAYVFRATSNATAPFTLPSPSAAVTPEAGGDAGYNYYIGTIPGNATYYALSGVENRALNPPVFTAYALGVAPGVTTKPNTTTVDVFIPIDVPLDHALTLEIEPPQVTGRGPDRVEANVVLRLSEAGYAILPGGRQSRLLPGSASFDFVGVPALTGSLANAHYVAFANAVTGSQRRLPHSFSGLFATTDSTGPIPLENFLEIPRLSFPEAGSRWAGDRLEITWPAGGVPVDLVVFEIESDDGLVTWTIAAPGSAREIELPDLRALAPDGALARGPLEVLLTVAQIRDFDYGSLRYRQLGTNGFNAYARDVFPLNY